jgi:hypothetical protein
MEPIQYMAGIRDKMVVTTRSDAFALLPTEKLFDRQQTAARLLSEMGGGFAMIYQEPPPKPDPEETIEKQPYRRLTGYLQGEGVMAIIEMEDVKSYLVRPGRQVGSTEWTCVSLDRDRAILRRPGAKLPHDIVVRLESKPVGGGGGGGGTGGGGGNAGGPPESGAGMAGERN